MFLVDSLPLTAGSLAASAPLSGVSSSVPSDVPPVTPPVAWAYLVETPSRGSAEQLSLSAILGVFCDSVARSGFVHFPPIYSLPNGDKPHHQADQSEAAAYETFLESLSANWQASEQGSDWQGVVEIVPRPGVTDTAGAVAGRLLQAAGVEVLRAHSKRFWLLSGADWRAQGEAIAARYANPLLHQTRLHSRQDWLAATGLADLSADATTDAPPPRFLVQRVESSPTELMVEVASDLAPDELTTLSKQGIADPVSGVWRGPLGLGQEDQQAIAQHFAALGRAPTDVELETLAQTWSEHCRHRIFAAPLQGAAPGAGTGGIFADFIRGTTEEILHRNRDGVGGFVVSTFSDNAGAVALNDSWLISDKVETHNSPSALDPFGGALTGILGVNRDCLGFGLGAQPIANRYGFFLPEPCDSRQLYRAPDRQAPLPAAGKVVSEVIRGVGFGGNCSGIPTPQGFVRFGAAYRGKPLVFCGTVGLLPRHLSDGRKSHTKAAQPGDAIVMAGGRVGKDGIHGATFSSEALTAASPATAVQLGDPFTQKKLADALLTRLRPRSLYRSLTDNGAGGLSSSDWRDGTRIKWCWKSGWTKCRSSMRLGAMGDLDFRSPRRYDSRRTTEALSRSLTSLCRTRSRGNKNRSLHRRRTTASQVPKPSRCRPIASVPARGSAR